MEGALEAASMGLVPAGAYRNREYFSRWSIVDSKIPQEMADLIFDPQTSGGLLVGIRSEKSDELVQAMASRGVLAVQIGEVIERSQEGHVEFVQ